MASRITSPQIPLQQGQQRNLRHLLLGQPEVIKVEKPAVEQLAGYLRRMVFSLPFPVTEEQAYFGLMPVALEQWFATGATMNFEGGNHKRTNLLKTMTLAKQHDKLHVRVSARGEKVFWFTAPPKVPIPPASKESPFLLPEEHPHYDVLCKWVNDAYLLEAEVEKTMRVLNKYTKIACTPAMVKQTWPDIMNFVRFTRGTMDGKGLSRTMREQLDENCWRVAPPETREEIVTQLARAAMMPEKSPPVRAWVKFYIEGVG